MTEEKHTFFLRSLKAGPHGVGDPNDLSLRKVEKDVLIPQKMRDRAKEEKCVKEVQEFSTCCKNANIMMAFRCRDVNNALVSCLTKWYNDPAFREECTQEYLKERSEYRRTGIPKPSKRRRATLS